MKVSAWIPTVRVQPLSGANCNRKLCSWIAGCCLARAVLRRGWALHGHLGGLTAFRFDEMQLSTCQPLTHAGQTWWPKAKTNANKYRKWNSEILHYGRRLQTHVLFALFDPFWKTCCLFSANFQLHLARLVCCWEGLLYAFGRWAKEALGEARWSREATLNRLRSRDEILWRGGHTVDLVGTVELSGDLWRHMTQEMEIGFRTWQSSSQMGMWFFGWRQHVGNFCNLRSFWNSKKKLICLAIYPEIYLSIDPYQYSSIHPSVPPSIHPFVPASIDPSVHSIDLHILVNLIYSYS